MSALALTAAATVTVPAAPARAATSPACQTTLPSPQQTIEQQPVVLVHGWTANASSMEGLAAALKTAGFDGYFFCFDYAPRATHWPSDPLIHQKLADALVSISGAFKRGGGDGRVLAAGHSMGGVALRYASRDTSAGVAVSSVLAGVVTFGTPHLGSPWGGTALASKLEGFLSKDQVALPPTASDAALCLAPLTRRASSCGDIPYLPSGVPLTELGTQITVHRTLFNIGIAKQEASIPLFGDGIVPQDSSHGYLFSGPSVNGSRKIGYGVTLDSNIATCDYSTDYLKSFGAGAVLGSGEGPVGALVGGLRGVLLNEHLDSAAEDALLSGSSSLALAELSAYAYRTPCFHTNLTTEPHLVKDALAAFQADLAASAPATSLTVSEVKVPPLGVPAYDTTGTYPQVSGGGVDLDAVNAALRSAVTGDQDAYRPDAVTSARDRAAYPSERGVYDVDSDASTVLANTRLVSTLYPTVKLYPGGNDGNDWLGTTVLVPSGKTVALADLFPTGNGYLQLLSDQLRRLVNQAAFCQPEGGDPAFAGIRQQEYDAALAPTPANFRNWALTPDGLDLGTAQGSFGEEACGTDRFEIPWKVLSPSLSPLGKQLMSWSMQGLAGRGVAPCTTTRLYAAAVTREHLDVHAYSGEPGIGPFADRAVCHDGWAIADISRPNVGTTDGQVLFRTSGLGWAEVAMLGNQGSDYCTLVRAGTPPAVARKFALSGPPAGSTC